MIYLTVYEKSDRKLGAFNEKGKYAYGPNMHVKNASALLTITGINKSHAVLKQFTPAANVADP
jgi:hypothetical protein